MFSVSKQNVHLIDCIPERSTSGFKGYDHVTNLSLYLSELSNTAIFFLAVFIIFTNALRNNTGWVFWLGFDCPEGVFRWSHPEGTHKQWRHTNPPLVTAGVVVLAHPSLGSEFKENVATFSILN